jgi:hypothetical protein
MATLIVKFAGICTHFRDVVPGVPHRAVLPNATSLRFGYLHLPWTQKTLPYYLLPHFPVLLTPKGVERPTVAGIIDDGAIYAGVHLKVMNATGTGVSHPGFEDTFSLMDFVPQYNYSDEVVFGGRAACYFDVTSGIVTTPKAPPGKARKTVIEITTDGAPVLMCTPFRSRATDAKTTPVTLKKNPTTDIDVYELTVGNMDISAPREDVQFDFMLNYLTSNIGIPDVITDRIPGWLGQSASDTGSLRGDEAARRQSANGPLEALKRLGAIVTTGRPSSADMDAMKPDEATLACSDSRYP